MNHTEQNKLLEVFHHSVNNDSGNADYSQCYNYIFISAIYSNGSSSKRILKITEVDNLEDKALVNFINLCIQTKSPVGLYPGTDACKTVYSEVVYVIETFQAPKSLVILGAGHVGRSLAILGSVTGFHVTLVDERQEFLVDKNLDIYKIVKLHSDFTSFLDFTDISTGCAIVIVTRGHHSDEICLRIALRTNAGYIGMIGSRRRVLAIKHNLLKGDLETEEITRLENIFAPIGLEIGAKTPQEIAISILAQVIKVMNRNAGVHT